jgi:hypothetical protein
MTVDPLNLFGTQEDSSMTAHPEQTAWLRCHVSPGMFDHELGVSGTQADGSAYSLFAPKEAVDSGTQPLAGGTEGWVRVRVLDRKGDHVLVELPGQTFWNGAFITVNADQIQTRPQKQPA